MISPSDAAITFSMVRASSPVSFAMPRKLASEDRRLIVALWLLAAYLLVLYAAVRWRHASPARFPGSD